ncbi:MAG TPA: cytochrome c biogenesis protein DipZ [Candidatus Sulfotelmatobacter sp.]|jgi:cytochrome c biogenesis protein CcdA/thiol-disulfide isomerase/thioredoxin|nr:cytochrome c biogenesis protein DipZ [Candidatus Sulfotelmatobacter sp.]
MPASELTGITGNIQRHTLEKLICFTRISNTDLIEEINMILLLAFSFLAGFVTILAPCIWPVLPIVLSSSIAGGKGHQKPLGITLGVMLSFTIFTLSISYFVKIFHFDPNVLRIFAVIIIAFLGLTMIIPALETRFELVVSRLANILGQNSKSKQGSGFLSGFITGLSLGIIWSPCAGPILATIATLAATGQVSFQVILVTLMYVTGVGVPLFAFAYGGQQFIVRARGINKYTGRIQQAFGILMIVAAIAIFTNYDQTLQLQLLNKFPALGTAVNGFENSNLVKNQLDQLKGKTTTQSIDTSSIFNANQPAPDFVGIDKWLNTDKPLTIASLKGKVVLVDFWTYTCINCIRTLPHVTSWYDKYNKAGFVVVGVHTPEFQFEHDTQNVRNAIKRYNIHYPVAQDNEYATWNIYSNQYWPAEYLIDANGTIRRTEFGEGKYDQMELAIRSLLQETGKKVTGLPEATADKTPQTEISPETYLGSKRMQYYFPSGSLSNGMQQFSLSDNLSQNSFSYGGQWTIYDEYAVSESNATLNYNFTASKVFIILRPGSARNPTVRVYLDGKSIDSSQAGSDVINGVITVASDRLYNVVDLKDKTENHILKFEFQTTGTQAFTLTFG